MFYRFRISVQTPKKFQDLDMLYIAITGGIACGKSLVGSIFSEKGFELIDADDIAHNCMMPGKQPYKDIVSEFGTEIINESGKIDRRLLSRLVFKDGSRLEKLNNFVHGYVIEEIKKLLKENADKNICAMIPLLFEVGLDQGWDAIISVIASRKSQIARLKARGVDDNQIDKRIDAQMDNFEKIKRADYVIFSEGGIDLLRKQVDQIVNSILESKYA